MAGLIVIEIVPQAPVDAMTFQGYLTNLRVQVFDLSFMTVDGDPPGVLAGSASYLANDGGWNHQGDGSYQRPALPLPSYPGYSGATTSGIVQQVDFISLPFGLSHFQLESVATAIITVNTPGTSANLRVEIQDTSGNVLTTIPYQYCRQLDQVAVPNPASWLTQNADGDYESTWATLPVDFYVSLPATATPTLLQLPQDGNPPPFDALLKAVRHVLATSDPGAVASHPTTGTAAAGGNTLSFAAPPGVSVGMDVSGSAAIPPGTTIVATAGNAVTLSQELSAAVPAGTVISFAPDLATLSLSQCQNIAYEIVWGQQPPLPAPSDPAENLYTNPPNSGTMLSGSSNSTPNQLEGDRQQFEGKLQSYYAVADTDASRLTTSVYALAAAIACEQQSVAATQAMLQFPANAAIPGAQPSTDTAVIITGVANAGAAGNFGVPAAFFYALAAAMPVQITAAQRFARATGDQLSRLLTDLTTAISAGTISDSESCVTVQPAVTINAAQAARRIAALGVPAGSATPLAPLGALALATTADAASGTSLSFAGTTGVANGMLVSGPGIAAGATVQSSTAAGVTLSAPVLNDVPAGSMIVFTPAYTTDMKQLVASWLAYPPAPQGMPSSQAYQPGDDDGNFWPSAAAAHQAAFLNLVLAALTQGYIIPAPFSSALGIQITTWLPTLPGAASPPTVVTLAAVTAEQWSDFYTANPTWLPPFTQPGNSTARIAAFIRSVQTLFAVSTSGPPSTVVLATSAQTTGGNNTLRFAATDRIVKGMRVTGLNIPPGTTVSLAPTATTVRLSQAVSATVPAQTNITFTPSLSGTGTSGTPGLPLLPEPPPDWLAQGLQAYGAFGGFGSGFDLTRLRPAAAAVFPDDPAAQAWLVDALVAIDALYQVMQNRAIAPAPSAAMAFSVVEALYARGFRAAADIVELDGAHFQNALTGTVAYDIGPEIYIAAGNIAGPGPQQSAAGGFSPVNPDGTLTNCIPAPCGSPLGPIAYLHEMLTVSELSTCDDVAAAVLTLSTSVAANAGDNALTFASAASVFAGMSASGSGIPADTTVTTTTTTTVTLDQALTTAAAAGTSVTFTAPTLGAALSQRRGPLGNLAASCANLETPLPLIDLVNERLEYLAAGAAPANSPVYDTAGDATAARMLAALPEYSTPATPVAANAAVEPAAFDKLKADFSSCLLPYAQALDVSRTYLRHLGSCRFEEMRAFRKCITEFVLDPAREPAGFQPWLWRYPVRADIAMEYLGITPEEYTTLFHGAAPPPCAPQQRTPRRRRGAIAALAVPDALRGTIGLPQFLAETCLSYCEFYELWQSQFVVFSNGAGEGDGEGEFPECEPCCLEDLSLVFAEGQQEQDLPKLKVFIRLWRKLRDSCCFCYSFAQLRDICDVLQLYKGGALNPDFVRQLAAFQMLRDHFKLDLTDADDKAAAGASGADRTHLLALWVGPAAAKWRWALRELIRGVEDHARQRHECQRRPEEFIKLLAANLNPLSRLAGFDPATASWHALPTHTLRFAEVLAKIYASDFTVGELIFLFTADKHLDGDDPFPLQEGNEALDSPLGLPDDDREHGLWRLRRDLLAVHVPAEEAEEWSWRRIETALHSEFGFAPDDVLALGQHFFPDVLTRSGYQVSPAATRFASVLDPAHTSAPMWNTPPDGPLRYDPAARQLSARIPLSDLAVIRKLEEIHHDLNAWERQAVQDLFFQPRAMLARFALLFDDFATAQRRLVEEADEGDRFSYFRHQFLLCLRRCHVIARRLAHHVAAATGQEAPEDDDAAVLILRVLAADENEAIPGWEDDSGAVPPLTWAPPPAGGALAALLGLAGTGLIAEYRPAGGAVAWRDGAGPLSGFGAGRDRENCPVPTVLPSFDAQLTPEQLRFASVHNGFLMKDSTGAWLGGAEGFAVTWSGALLVEREGTYEFWAGAPAPGDERPDFEAAEHRRWRVTLRRGQRRWVILSHHWAGEEEHRSFSLPLRPGAYELTAELVQPSPEFSDDEQVRHQHTGFQVKYSGPDSGERRTEIPHRQLFVIRKHHPLGYQIPDLSPAATAYLSALYLSSLRDIRRTYQRAFKALLFTHRFALSARRQPHGTSELGYLLSQPERFAGAGFYRAGAGYTRHAADFDFDFLPLRDDYHPPEDDARADPKPQRIQAMFDWWERIFDYTAARAEVHRRCGRHLWHLFEEAQETQPADPRPLLRHMGADARRWHLDLRYFQGQHVPVYAVSSADLEDERWTLRAWHADRWLRAAQRCFAAKDIDKTRPDLWASDDPSAVVEAGHETGNANLLAFVTDSCLENGEPPRYEDLKRLNDGLRERGRNALVAYLCHLDRVPLPWQPGQFATVGRDLSDLLLLDVEASTRERASRIDEAITAAQSYVRRARLGLEPGWTATPAFARLWDRQFATFHIWQACKRKELYKENWVEWDALARARGIEAFRFLDDRLRDAQLTVAVPGGLEWWPDQRPPAPGNLEPVQRPEPSGLLQLASPCQGIDLVGTPENNARPSWLAALGTAGQQSGNELPYWLHTAIRLGTPFVRIAAAGLPPAGNGLVPHRHRGPEDCVTCCEECGCAHDAVLDEYYFWLVDGRFYEPPVTPAPSGFTAPSAAGYQDGYQEDFYDPAQQEAALWEDPEQLPQLLYWQGSPLVRLAWCRVHNGKFQQPRRSVFGVAVTDTPGQSPALTFLGRTADSLTFSVSNSVAPDGYADPSQPGFRYDIATDEAVVLPQVMAPPSPPAFVKKLLPAYPYFAFFAPGTHLIPLSPFAPALAVASALRARCRFEAALGWYRLAFNPLQQDCTWVECEEGTRRDSLGACCDSTDISCAQARDRAVLLHYLETMAEWADAVRRRGTPEAFQQARVILDAMRVILGPRPHAVQLRPPATPPTVSGFMPDFPPLNPRLLDIYDLVEDRLALIHATVNARRLQDDREIPYFGGGTLREGWRGEEDACADECDWCHLPSPYRFMFLIQKAQEYATRAAQLGGSLLSAFEKGDAEFLAALRAGQELELLTIALEAKKDQWREADWQVEALQAGKSASQANLIYTNGLINAGPGGLIDGEIQYQDLTNTALSLRGTADVIEGVGEALRLIPDLVLGAAGFGGSPVSVAWIPLGTKIGGALEAVARIINNSAEIDTITAGLDQTDATWLRRYNDWIHQAQVLAIQIHQAERQILGAQRNRDRTLTELTSHRRQIEQSREVKDFLRDKFTAHELYLFLQKETLALYRTTYDLALDAARQAQRAFNLERGYTTRRFIPDCAWDDLREGLLAGERLSAGLRHMEKAYLDENVREYELTKTFSLRMHFPLEFLRLRTTGKCEIEIPEWMFDLETPGMYMRRIKSVSLTIPCVTGPYTGVHCRLTLIGSTTRIDATLRPPAHECCWPPEPCRDGCGDDDCGDEERRAREYDLCPDDPRAVRHYDARQAIATSSGQNDSGLFQLNFEDPRYLPFEYMGAVSRWRIELPIENNYFPLHTVTDALLTVNYTAREGGELLRRAANASAQRRLPGDGWHFFDIRHEFPDAWQLFRRARSGEDEGKRLTLRLTRQMFPFIPGSRDLWVDKMAIVFGISDGAECGCPDITNCPCPSPCAAAEREIDFAVGHGEERDAHQEQDDDREETDVRCFAGKKGPGLYCGAFDTRIGPLTGDHGREFDLRFPARTGDLERMFLLCRYRVSPVPHRCQRHREG